MSFTTAQYHATADKVRSGAETIATKIPQVTAAVNGVVDQWYIPGFVKDAVRWLAGEIVAGAEQLWRDVLELLRGVAVPVYLFEYAWRWEDNAGTASGIAAALTPENVGVTPDWTGAAATAYRAAIRPQSRAAGEIGSISGSVATSLVACALAGSAFYVAVGAIAFQVVTTLVEAIAVLGTGVLSVPGLAMVLGDINLTPTMIWSVIGAVTALVGAEASQMVSLHGLAVTSTEFPGGRWPHATIGT